MAQTTSRASSSRSRSSGSSGARRTSSGGSSSAQRSSGASSNGSSGSAEDNGRSIVKDAIVPVSSVVLGAAAGIVLGQLQSKKRKKVLGVPIPGTGKKNGADGLAKSIGEAGKQIARLADEVNTSRRKAEEIGKALQ
jgi:hypothetical protein